MDNIDFDDIEEYDKFIKCFHDIEFLDKGGQKVVYSAIHNELGKVVIKVIQFNPVIGSPRIDREVHSLRSIESPFFPKNYEFKKFDIDKKMIILEEYIDHISEKTIFTYYTNNEEKIVNLLKLLIDGLKILWDKNIVHRDIKPKNILIKSNYKPVIIDLGIARFLKQSSITFSKRGPLTPIYAAPEMIIYNKHLIDMRTDFFLLGIVLLEFYFGFHPFSVDKIGGDSIQENIINLNYYKPENEGASNKFCLLFNNLLVKQSYKRFNDYNKMYWPRKVKQKLSDNFRLRFASFKLNRRHKIQSV